MFLDGFIDQQPTWGKKASFSLLVQFNADNQCAPNSELAHSPASPWVETLKLDQLPGKKFFMKNKLQGTTTN